MWLSPSVKTTDTGRQILAEFDRLVVAENFTPAPSGERSAEGRYAFSADVIVTILLGVVTGVLTDIISHFLLRERNKGETPPTDPSAFNGVVAKARDARQAILLLKEQGLSEEDAEKMLDLLEKAIQKVLRGDALGDQPANTGPPDHSST